MVFRCPACRCGSPSPRRGAPLPQGEVGVIEVKGPNVFKGYWRMPEKTAAEFRADGYFITGDLGKIDERGYVHIVGRAKDLDHLGRLQRLSQGGRRRDRRDGRRRRERGDRRCRTRISARGSPPSSCREKGAMRRRGRQCSRALEGRLAKYKAPKRVMFVDELPRNAMGKVQKAALRAKYHDLYS